MSLQHFDVIIVGGGPAGSACAARLVEGGAHVAVLDRAGFPRLKLCAGWITPEVVDDLALDVDAYPHRFNTFEKIVVYLKGIPFSLATPQHSIRRIEFDAYLLERSGATAIEHKVNAIAREGKRYVIDDAYTCDYLVGAGGTRCPVYRELFRVANPRAKHLQAATYEFEFPYEWKDPRCHLWFLDKGLPGYAWYVPKADGYLNCGIGGMADKLKARGEDIKTHWQHFTRKLGLKGFVQNADLAPKGYSYFLRGNVDVVRIDNAFITGDAAGLATRDMCEGIGPAVRSGQRAAAAITHGLEYQLDDIGAFSSANGIAARFLERMFAGGRLEVSGAA
ncbi:MAG: NAD(P)-binding protein [Gammaproteobacteria bacterium]